MKICLLINNLPRNQNVFKNQKVVGSLPTLFQIETGYAWVHFCSLESKAAVSGAFYSKKLHQNIQTSDVNGFVGSPILFAFSIFRPS